MKMFIIPTKRKILIAKILSGLILSVRKLFGLDGETEVKRQRICWRLDLHEGIDLAIYLGVYERETLSAWKGLVAPGSVVLDIGANIGAHTLPLASLVGCDGKVIAFEPTAYAFEKLCANIALNPALGNRIEAHRVHSSIRRLRRDWRATR